MFKHEPVDLGYKDLKAVTKTSGRKYLIPNGNLYYPSITTILGQLSKAAIMAWRDRVGHEEANKISRQAAGRGTAVHAMCESYVNNDPNYAKDAMPNILNDFKRCSFKYFSAKALSGVPEYFLYSYLSRKFFKYI